MMNASRRCLCCGQLCPSFSPSSSPLKSPRPPMGFLYIDGRSPSVPPVTLSRHSSSSTISSLATNINISEEIVSVEKKHIHHREAIALLQLLDLLNLNIATAESVTGGMICSTLVSVAGYGSRVLGGIISYDTGVKTGLLGVDLMELPLGDVFSAECALAMAIGVQQQIGADVNVSVSGHAGPGAPKGALGKIYCATTWKHHIASTLLHVPIEHLIVKNADPVSLRQYIRIVGTQLSLQFVYDQLYQWGCPTT